jgi:hypothetical protein
MHFSYAILLYHRRGVVYLNIRNWRVWRDCTVRKCATASRVYEYKRIRFYNGSQSCRTRDEASRTFGNIWDSIYDELGLGRTHEACLFQKVVNFREVFNGHNMMTTPAFDSLFLFCRGETAAERHKSWFLRHNLLRFLIFLFYFVFIFNLTLCLLLFFIRLFVVFRRFSLNLPMVKLLRP